MTTQDQLIGELKEFKRVASHELFLIRMNLENLNKFKWTMYAMSGMISSIVALLVTFLRG